MNLDDKQQLSIWDSDRMLNQIHRFPDDLADAWAMVQDLPLPQAPISQVVFGGMGHSANAGALLAGLMSATSALPSVLIRDYQLPKWAQTPSTLVVISSFSGETEEMLSLQEQCQNQPTLVLSTGGTLSSRADLLWSYPALNHARTTLGWQLGFLLALAHRMNWLSELDQQLPLALEQLRANRELYGIENTAATNPAKRKAGQFMGRLPIIYGAGIFEAAAYRWKTLLNATAKLMAMFEAMPEANHHSLVGMEFPVFLMPHVIPVFIRSREFDHPRIQVRYDLMTRFCLENGLSPNDFWAKGTSPLAQILHALQYSDYVSFYAAIGAEVDPARVDLILQMKTDLSEIS